MTNDDEPSPELTKLREEAGILTNVFSILGEATIRAKEATMAVKLLDYMDNLLKLKVDEINSLVASETLGADVKMDGTVLSMAKKEVEH